MIRFHVNLFIKKWLPVNGVQTSQCKLLRANCNYYDNQVECQIQDGCDWNEGRCQKKQIQIQSINCEDFISYTSCVALKEGQQACTQEHNKCIPISKCSEINDFMQCRNSRLKDKCQLVINHISSYMGKQYFYFGDIFDEYECRAKDCKFNQFTSCNNFVNGRRCFQYLGECTQCSYFTTNQSCLDTNQSIWDNGFCRNIMYYDFKEKQLCNQNHFVDLIKLIYNARPEQAINCIVMLMIFHLNLIKLKKKVEI